MLANSIQIRRALLRIKMETLQLKINPALGVINMGMTSPVIFLELVHKQDTEHTDMILQLTKAPHISIEIESKQKKSKLKCCLWENLNPLKVWFAASYKFLLEKECSNKFHCNDFRHHQHSHLLFNGQKMLFLMKYIVIIVVIIIIPSPYMKWIGFDDVVKSLS